MASALYMRMWAIVKKIPRGRVATYGQIAALAGIPRAPRQAGYALRALPDGSKVPWHRVINAEGRVSTRVANWEGGSDSLQRILLEDEGVVFDASGKVDLATFQWRPAPRG